MKTSLGQSIIRIIIVGTASLILAVFGNIVHPRGVELRQPIYAIAEQQQCTVGEGTLNPPGTWASSAVGEILFLLQEQKSDPNFLVIGDIRSETEYAKAHLPHAIHIPCRTEQGQALLKFAQKKGILLLYDQTGESKELEQAAKIAAQNGVERVSILEGGFLAWKAKNGPIESGSCQNCGFEEKKEKAAKILPKVNAAFNAISLVLLSIGFWMIRKKKVAFHQFCMLSAFGTSILFLLFYCIRIYLTGTHRFPYGGFIKMAYYTILFSHMILAAVTPFLAITAIYFALHQKFSLHKKIVRFAWPMWVYVSLTGIIVYVMLYHLG